MVKLEDDDLDDEDRAILAEVAKKGYYHGRPKSEAIAPPVRIDTTPQPIGLDTAHKSTRTEFDNYQKRWDKFDDDGFLKELEVEIGKQMKLQSEPTNPLSENSKTKETTSSIGTMPALSSSHSPSKPEPRRTSVEISCKCGYSCGTMTALGRHLDRFPGDAMHGKVIRERSLSPLKPVDQSMQNEVLREEMPARSLPSPRQLNQPAERKLAREEVTTCRGKTLVIGCKCGYNCGSRKALSRHLERFPMSADHEENVYERERSASPLPTSGQPPEQSQCFFPPIGDLGCICGFSCSTIPLLKQHLDLHRNQPDHSAVCS